MKKENFLMIDRVIFWCFTWCSYLNTTTVSKITFISKQHIISKVIPGRFAWQNAVDRCKAVSEISNYFKFEDFCKTNHKGAWIGFYTTTSEEDRIKYSGMIREHCVVFILFINWMINEERLIWIYNKYSIEGPVWNRVPF